MNEFIHLPPYENYLSRWINLAHIKIVQKMGDERVQITYINNDKEVLSGVWAKVILDSLGEQEFFDALNTYDAIKTLKHN